MIAKPIFAVPLLFGAMLLAACSSDVDDDPEERGIAQDAPSPVASASEPDSQPQSADDTAAPLSSPPAGYTDGNGINENYPDLRPAALIAEQERGEKGARNVLLSFIRAIELREYNQAWDMLGPEAKGRWSREEFNLLFAGLDEITVAAPGGTMEGAAGSSYYATEADITATDGNGRTVRLEGPLVLKRVNDVAGATAQQLRWRIERLDLAQTH